MTAHAWTDTITILRAPGQRLAKQVKADDSFIDYDSPYRFNATAVPVSGLLDVLDVLRRLIVLPDRCVVRGELLAGRTATGIRRLAYECKKTGDAATMRNVPRRWLGLDADGVERPANVNAADLEACADIVLAELPPVFARTAMIVQATAGHGIKPGCRLRLWFWCDRPMAGRELVRWLKGTPLDPSVFRPVQPIYTSAPVFSAGRADHLPNRLLELSGLDWLKCPSVEELADPPAKPQTPPERLATGDQASEYARAALVFAADAILSAKEGKRHYTITNEARSLARLVRAGLLRTSDMARVLSTAAERAGKTDADEVASCIEWGLANPSDGKLPEMSNAA